MATLQELRLDVEAIDHALAALSASARAIAAGFGVAASDLDRLIAFFERTVHGTHSREVADRLHRDVKVDDQQGRGLLGVLRGNIDQLDGSGQARRRFFHAARTYVTVRHALVEDERRWIATIERGESHAPLPAPSSEIIALLAMGDQTTRAMSSGSSTARSNQAPDFAAPSVPVPLLEHCPGVVWEA